MIVDSFLLFSDAQAITAAAASTNAVDLGAVERRIGTGRELYVVVIVDTAFTDAGSDSTLTVDLQSDSVEAFSSAATVQTVGTLAALSAAGARLISRIPPDTLTERFIRLNYTPNNGNLTTGAVTAFITVDIHAFQPYPDGFTIS